MTLQIVSRAVFGIGVLSAALAALVNWSTNQSSLNSEFVAATTVVSDENFADMVRANEKPIVMDFFGDYCFVCEQLEPKYLALAQEFSEDAVFARVDIQDAPELVELFEVRQVPTLVVVHQGNLLFHGSGLGAVPLLQKALRAINGKDAS